MTRKLKELDAAIARQLPLVRAVAEKILGYQPQKVVLDDDGQHTACINIGVDSTLTPVHQEVTTMSGDKQKAVAFSLTIHRQSGSTHIGVFDRVAEALAKLKCIEIEQYIDEMEQTISLKRHEGD